MNKNLQENIVPATKQNESNVFFYGNGEKKILFVGNSITKHAPKADIGWYRDCGMAASSADADYVHLLARKFTEYYGEEISYGIVQVAVFEWNLNTENIEKYFSSAKDYNPNVMFMFFGANVSSCYETEENPPFKFGDSYAALRNYLIGDNTTVIHSQGYYIRPKLDAEKLAVAEKYNDAFVNIEGIRNREETHGMFNHPNDLGMKEIADAFFETAIRSIENEIL